MQLCELEVAALAGDKGLGLCHCACGSKNHMLHLHLYLRHMVRKISWHNSTCNSKSESTVASKGSMFEQIARRVGSCRERTPFSKFEHSYEATRHVLAVQQRC